MSSAGGPRRDHGATGFQQRQRISFELPPLQAGWSKVKCLHLGTRLCWTVQSFMVTIASTTREWGLGVFFATKYAGTAQPRGGSATRAGFSLPAPEGQDS